METDNSISFSNFIKLLTKHEEFSLIFKTKYTKISYENKSNKNVSEVIIKNTTDEKEIFSKINDFIYKCTGLMIEENDVLFTLLSSIDHSKFLDKTIPYILKIYKEVENQYEIEFYKNNFNSGSNFLSKSKNFEDLFLYFKKYFLINR